MTYVNDADIYYNTQVYFRQHCMNGLPNDSRAWSKAFRDWLATQGCEIEQTRGDVVRNSLDFAPYYDSFKFSNDCDATIFILRWS